MRLLPALLIGLSGWAISFPAGPAVCQDLDRAGPTAIQIVTRRVQESVVRIETFGGSRGPSASRGGGQTFTGTALGSPGWIVTAALQVADQPEAILVRLPDGQRVNATVAGRDRARQIVLLRLESGPHPPPLKIASGVTPGQTAIALGKVFDPAIANVSTGIVSATGRIDGRAIQTDAAISANNYGGPLLNLDGEVLGILVPLSPASDRPQAGRDWYDSGIGFAVPVRNEELQRMAAGETLQRGKTGITFREDNGFASRPVVAAVAPNSPAARSGLLADDEIRSVNGKPVQLLTQVRLRLGPLYAGDSVNLEVARQGQLLELELTLAERIDAWQAGLLGVLTDAMVDRDRPGVAVRQVAAGSPADSCGIRPGDRITQIDGQPIESQAELAGILAHRAAESELELEWIRDRQRSRKSVSLAGMNASPWPVEKQLPAADQVLREVRLPGDPIRAWLYSPPRAGDCRLLVWLGSGTAGQVRQEAEAWIDLADAFRVNLLVIPAAAAGGWKADEVDRINALTRQAVNELGLNRWQVAVGGRTRAGQLASLAALQTPALYRGLVLIDSSLDFRVTDEVANPVHSQLVAWLGTSPERRTGGGHQGSAEQLDENGYPVWQDMVPNGNWPESVFRWMASLDRL